MLVRVGNEFIQGATAAGTQYYQANRQTPATQQGTQYTTAPKGN